MMQKETVPHKAVNKHISAINRLSLSRKMNDEKIKKT